MTFLLILSIIGAGTIVYGLFSVVHYVQNLLWDYRQLEKRVRDARDWIQIVSRDLDNHKAWHREQDKEQP